MSALNWKPFVYGGLASITAECGEGLQLLVVTVPYPVSGHLGRACCSSTAREMSTTISASTISVFGGGRGGCL